MRRIVTVLLLMQMGVAGNAYAARCHVYCDLPSVEACAANAPCISQPVTNLCYSHTFSNPAMRGSFRGVKLCAMSVEYKRAGHPIVLKRCNATGKESWQRQYGL